MTYQFPAVFINLTNIEDNQETMFKRLSLFFISFEILNA